SLALRQYQYLGREIGDLGNPGQKTEQHKRVMVQIGRAAAALGPTRPAGDVGAEHMVGRRQPLIADRLGRLRKIADRRGLPADIDDRQRHPELHLSLRSASLSLARDCVVAALLAMTTSRPSLRATRSNLAEPGFRQGPGEGRDLSSRGTIGGCM